MVSNILTALQGSIAQSGHYSVQVPPRFLYSHYDNKPGELSQTVRQGQYPSSGKSQQRTDYPQSHVTGTVYSQFRWNSETLSRKVTSPLEQNRLRFVSFRSVFLRLSRNR